MSSNWSFCLPDTPKVWIDVDEKALLDGVPRLTEKSRLLCKHGGEISFGKGNPYGIEDFLQDLFTGKYASTITLEDWRRTFKGFYDNKLVAGYLDITGGYTDITMAVEAAGLLMASETATMREQTIGYTGAVITGVYGLSNAASGVGDFLEGVEAGEHDWDFLKRGARWISPENGEMIYDCGNLLKSGRGAIESKKIMDIVSSGKDFNDVLDETQKKIEKYNEDIDAVKKNVIEYVNDGAKEFRRYIPEHVGEKKNQYPTDVKVDKNLGVLFDVFR